MSNLYPCLFSRHYRLQKKFTREEVELFDQPSYDANFRSRDTSSIGTYRGVSSSTNLHYESTNLHYENMTLKITLKNQSNTENFQFDSKGLTIADKFQCD